jgi:hypothetical protein
MTQPEWTTPPAPNAEAPAYGPASSAGNATPASTPAFPVESALESGSALSPAPILSRFVAFLVDFGGTVVLTTAVVFLCISGLDSSFGNGGDSSSASDVLSFVGFAAIFVIPLGSVILNVTLSRTRMYSVGQALMRIRLVDARSGAAASIGSIIGRMLLLVVPGIATVTVAIVVIRSILSGAFIPAPSIATIVFPVVLALTVIPMMRGDRRGWHDKATNQRVVAVSPRL